MHGIVKKLGAIEKILAYLNECIHVDGKVKLLLQILLQALHIITVVEFAFFCTCNTNLCALILHRIQMFSNNCNCNMYFAYYSFGNAKILLMKEDWFAYFWE